MTMSNEHIDELIKDCKTQEDLFGEKGIVKQFVKRVTERALKGELTFQFIYIVFHKLDNLFSITSINCALIFKLYILNFLRVKNYAYDLKRFFEYLNSANKDFTFKFY